MSRLFWLGHLNPSITYQNVWDLPLSQFRHYAGIVDEWLAQKRKG